MRKKSMLAMGFVAIVAATGIMNASDSVAAGAQRVDVIESPRETVAQEDSVKAGVERARVDVIERIAPEGTAYPYSQPMSH